MFQAKRFVLSLLILCMVILCITRGAYAESDLYAVIEIGASGIKVAVIQLLPKSDSDNEMGMEIRKKFETDDKNALNPKALEQSGEAVKEMFAKVQNEFAVPSNHIFIVGSSGISNISHKEELKDIIRKNTDKTMDFISAEKEAGLLFKGIVSPKRRKQVVVIDIGSGNIKGSYLEKSKPDIKLASFEIPWGVKKVAAEIDETRGDGDFKEAADRFREKTLTRAIREQIQLKPGLQNLKRVYLAGGIIWAMATLIRPEAQKSFVKVTSEDITTFYNRATRNSDLLLNPDLRHISDNSIREKAEDQIEKLKRGVFSKNQLIAGSEVLKALSTELEFSRKTMFFDRDALYAWSLGYLEEQTKQGAIEEEDN